MVRMQMLCTVGCALLLGTADPCFPKAPCVEFDVIQTVAARELSTSDSTPENPTEKLIRLELPISSFVRLGREDSLIQFVYVVSGLSEPFQIVDYSPKTALATDVAGHLTIEETQGKSSTLGIKAHAAHESQVQADANANVGASSSNSVRFQQLPPRQLVAASGTMHRGRSAYFKLKPSTQTTLEGDKTFEVIARVPASWRVGLVHVSCAAYAKSRGFSAALDETELVCGSRGFLVGAHLAGDVEAKQRIWQLVRSQQQLKLLAKTHADDIADSRYPSFGHKIGASLSLVKPRIPDSWLDQILASGELPNFEKYLPRSVRTAAIEYHKARQDIAGLASRG